MENLLKIYENYKENGIEKMYEVSTQDARELFYLVIIFVWEEKYEEAFSRLEKCEKLDSSNLLYEQFRIYLGNILKNGKENVYSSGLGFEKFINDGGNVPLYKNTISLLQQIYSKYDQQLKIMDIGNFLFFFSLN